MKINFNTYNNNLYKKNCNQSFGATLRFDYNGDIFSPYEVEMIKNRGGNFRKRIDAFKNLFLEKYGYSRGLVPHIIRDKIKGQNLGYRACFAPNSGNMEILREKTSNTDMVAMIGHELRHFMQYANMFKHIGLSVAEEIIRLRTISALNTKLNNNEIENKHVATVEKIVEALRIGTPIINRYFWKKAVDQTPYPDTFGNEYIEKTIKERIDCYSIQPKKNTDTSSIYEYLAEKRDYISSPYESDAYDYEEKLMHNLGLPYTNYLKQIADNINKLEQTFDKLNPNVSKEKRKDCLIDLVDRAVSELDMYYKELSPEDEISVIKKAITLIKPEEKVSAPSFKGLRDLPIKKGTEVISSDDISFIKSLNGTFEDKTQKLKGLFSSKYGYEKDLIPLSIEPVLEDDDYVYSGRINFNTGLLRISKGEEDSSNEELATTIAHELRHFYQYAKLYKSVGINKIYKINEGGNKAWFKQIILDYFDIIKRHKLWHNPMNIIKVIKILNEHRKKFSHIDIPFWTKAIEQTDDTPFDSTEFLDTFINLNKKQRLIDENSETYNYFKGNRDYMLDPFEKDAHIYEANLRNQLGLDTSSIDNHMEMAFAYDKIERILNTLPRTDELTDNEDYFYFLINEVFKKLNLDINTDRFFETHQQKMNFLKSMYEAALDLQKKTF